MLATTDLESWVQSFLRGVGTNVPFADGLLLEPRSFFGPLDFPLAQVTRCCGPEETMRYRTPQEDFERRVESLRTFHRGGGTSPPLIVNFSEGGFHLNDGNHRHEALVRGGATSFPMIIWTTGEQDRQQFLEAYGPWLDIDAKHREGLVQGRQGVVGCLVIRPDGRIFAQKRSASRKTFPGCWDLVGGHVEEGESVREALVRELKEETGWEFDKLLGLRQVVDWEVPGPSGNPVLKREMVVALTIRGGWDTPVLEADKVTEGRWFRPEELPLLNENRSTDTYVHDLFQEEFAR